MTMPKEFANEMITAPTIKRAADTSSVCRRPIESRSAPEISKPPNPATKLSPEVAASFSNVDKWSCKVNREGGGENGEALQWV